MRIFRQFAVQIHAAAQAAEVNTPSLLVQVAVYLAEVLLNQGDVQLIQAGQMIHTIIKGHIVRKSIQLTFLFFRGLNGACHFTDPVDTFPAIFAHIFRRRVWAHAAAGSPHNKEHLTGILYDFSDGHILRLNQFALIQHILLIFIHALTGNADLRI